jgi:hypothetical protein
MSKTGAALLPRHSAHPLLIDDLRDVEWVAQEPPGLVPDGTPAELE